MQLEWFSNNRVVHVQFSDIHPVGRFKNGVVVVFTFARIQTFRLESRDITLAHLLISTLPAAVYRAVSCCSFNITKCTTCEWHAESSRWLLEQLLLEAYTIYIETNVISNIPALFDLEEQLLWFVYTLSFLLCRVCTIAAVDARIFPHASFAIFLLNVEYNLR